jgi:hypothetical protein
MVRALLVVPAVLAVLLVVLWACQRHLIYLPSTAPVGSAGAAIPGARDVVLETSDGLELGAWFVPAGKPDRGLAVLVANGNAGDRSGRAPLARRLAGHGLAVLLFDYRGYGANPGSPSEDGLSRDVRAARDYLVEEAGVRPARVLYYGESLGAAVVTELAAAHPPGGLVLRSPFVDLATVGHHHYPFLPVRTLLRDRYLLVEHLADVHVPVTVVYGTADSVVPPDQSRAVAASAPELSRLVEVARADHNDPVLLHGARLVRAVVDLAEQIRATS